MVVKLHLPTKKARSLKLLLSFKFKWCHDSESNQGHRDFQSLALPTELSWLLFFYNNKNIFTVKYYLYIYYIFPPAVALYKPIIFILFFILSCINNFSVEFNASLFCNKSNFDIIPSSYFS